MASEARISGDPSFISRDARLEKVFDGASQTEGPCVALDGMVYFSDMTVTFRYGNQAGHIWCYDPRTGETKIHCSPSAMANGRVLDAEGNLITAHGADFGGRFITRTDLRTGKSFIIAGLYNGRPLNSPNDVSVDEQGRIYFTDPRYVGHEAVDQPVQGVYRIDPDQSVHLIIADCEKPNGIVVSPDQSTLYVADRESSGVFDSRRFPRDDPNALPRRRGRCALLAYALSPLGTARYKQTIHDFAPQAGPDGMKADAEGNIWCTSNDEARPGIVVFSPAGEELAFIPTPDPPTNVCFDRSAKKPYLYITASKNLYRIRVEKPGYHVGRV